MKKIFRVFLYTNYKKEEKWLDSMSQNGWNFMKKKFFIYYFENDNTSYIYKKCYLPIRKEKEIIENLITNQENKVELLCRNGHWYYFRRNSALGQFELFNDYDSELSFLTSLRNCMIVILTLLMLFFELTFGIFQNHFLNALYIGIYLGISLIICINFIPALKRILYLKKDS